MPDGSYFSIYRINSVSKSYSAMPDGSFYSTFSIGAAGEDVSGISQIDAMKEHIARFIMVRKELPNLRW